MTVDEDAMATLRARSWPGNVRELRSFLKVALVGTTGSVLQLRDTGPRPASPDTMAFEGLTYDEAKREFRRRYYIGLQAACRGNVTEMAKRAGKQRLTVREALRELELDRGSDPEQAPGRSGAKRSAHDRPETPRSSRTDADTHNPIRAR